MNKKILIFGGSGFIGTSLVKSLLQKNNQLCVICSDHKKALKNLSDHKNLQIKAIDIFDELELKKLLKNYDVIINLIGKLFEAKDLSINITWQNNRMAHKA